MSSVHAVFDPLPFRLRENIASYVRSVEDALDGILEDAGVTFTDRQRDVFLFLVGLRKLYAFTTSSFWAVDNAGEYLRKQFATDRVVVGGTDLSRFGLRYREMQSVVQTFDALLAKQQVPNTILSARLSDLAKWVVNGS